MTDSFIRDFKANITDPFVVITLVISLIYFRRRSILGFVFSRYFVLVFLLSITIGFFLGYFGVPGPGAKLDKRWYNLIGMICLSAGLLAQHCMSKEDNAAPSKSSDNKS